MEWCYFIIVCFDVGAVDVVVVAVVAVVAVAVVGLMNDAVVADVDLKPIGMNSAVINYTAYHDSRLRHQY